MARTQRAARSRLVLFPRGPAASRRSRRLEKYPGYSSIRSRHDWKRREVMRGRAIQRAFRIRAGKIGVSQSDEAGVGTILRLFLWIW